MNRIVCGLIAVAMLAVGSAPAEAGILGNCNLLNRCAPKCCTPAPVCKPTCVKRVRVVRVRTCRPAPTCCAPAPAPTCCAPAPAPAPCCAPAPAPAPCCAPAPAPAPCCAPAPAPAPCCAPAPVCCKPACPTTCCTPRPKRCRPKLGSRLKALFCCCS